MKKLKNIDFKALFINHGEKFAFALIGVIVVLALSGTSWSRYPDTPDALKTKITAAKERITSPSNNWPVAKSEEFATVDFNSQARDVFMGLETAKYEFTTPLFWPLYRKKEKAREPEFSAPQYLIAEAGEAVLGISSQPEMTAMTEDDPLRSPASDSPTESTLKPGPGIPQAGGATTEGFGIPTMPPNPTRTSATGSGARGPARPPASGPGAGHSAAQMMTTMTPGMETYGMGSMGGGGVTARGKRYIAVRAIVPIKEQIERAMKALNMSYADASAAIEYTDFTLQRQAAIAGPDPWAGEWETVKKEYALEVLKDSSDFDPDPVPSDLQDAVFTMPLPYRLLRYWGDHATHPNIKNFQLTEAEMKREEQMAAKVMEEINKLNLQSEPKVKKKGLTDAVNDIRAAGRELVRSSESASMMQDMARYMNEGATGPRMGVTDIQSRLTASGRVYLFRYFDFDVQPGVAYRYRVKLELSNPNFERPYEEVEDQTITKGPYRETGWSNISNPTVVPETVNYFLKEVERDPVRDERNSRKPVASIAMFEWDANLGTMLADTLKILNVGQFIAEKKKSWVLDPGTPTFEEKEVPFVTEDMLVDASADLELSPELHPDLKLKPERGKRDVSVGMLPEALVVTGSGQLKELDPVSDTGEERALKNRVEEERRNFLYLKDAPAQNASALDGTIPGMEGMPMPGMEMGPGRGNPRKRRDRGAGAAGAEGAHGSAEGDAGGAAGPTGRSTGSRGRNTKPNRSTAP